MLRSGCSLKMLRLAAGGEGASPWVMAMKVVPFTTNPTQDLGPWIPTDCEDQTGEGKVHSAVENSVNHSIISLVVFCHLLNSTVTV